MKRKRQLVSKMKRLLTLLTVPLLLVPVEGAQKRKPTRPRTVAHKPAAPEVKPPVSPLAGTSVVIITKNRDRIVGTIIDLNAYSIRIKSEGLEAALALDTISSLTFGSLGRDTPKEPQPAASSEDFARDLNLAVGAFQAMMVSAKPGADYTDYGRQLSELRPQAERFIARYGTSENAKESRVVGLLAGALTDYSWARTVWTLKLGRQSDGTVAEADSSVISDLLTLYPDLRSSATTGNRFAADRLIAGLWRKASEKVERVGK